MEILTKDFYSNCFIQSIKQKIRHPIKTKLTYICPKYGESYFFVPHFLWSNGIADYDFGIEKHLKWYEVFWFKGNIRKRPLGWNLDYKRRRIEKYNIRQAKLKLSFREVNMKIGQLNERCGNCKVVDYCAEPFDELCLCTYSRLAEVEEERYIELAEQSHESENADICEDVISKLI